ncbi:MAG: energy-coupling factor transporter ATPase [Clostridia bacterium]|nr:energy-coupling factor transporter ATPase [Clostridia bacterium]
MAEPFIIAENLTYTYSGEDGESTPALRGVSFTVAAGEYVAVLGHNGSGKSTLAKLLNAILTPSGGKLTVGGHLIKSEMTDDEIFAVRRDVGMVFQNPDNQLVATIVEEDVAFGPENLGIPRDEIRMRVDDALKTVGMYEYKSSQPHRLSGGQKQRVAIAGVISMMPRCIIFDESTAMLDPRGRAEVMKTIRRLNHDFGMTVLHITHYMDEAVQADRVMVINDGLLFADGGPKEVFSDVAALRAVGLDAPQGRELMDALAADGIVFSDQPISVEECAACILEQYQRANETCGGKEKEVFGQ